MMGIRNAVHSRALIKEKLTADPDSEISKRLRVLLMCPLGQMRLTVPCRAVTCSHLQCFDAALFLQMNEKKPTWKCPVCGENAAFKSLFIDGLFMDILNECTDVDQIEFQEDGRWCPMRPESHETRVEVSSQSSSSSDDSSSSDEEPDPPVKISVAVAPHATAGPGETGKKVGVSDLASETASSSSETASSEEEEETNPPAKKQCLDKEIHSKGVPNGQALDTPCLPSARSDQSTLATIPADMQRTQIAGMVHQSVFTTEDFKVPDKMVGFIIGKGGERISRIRLESGCKINIAKTGETIDRPCTLTGTPENIEKAKRLLKISMEQYRPLLSEQKILIPANKVGLVIGKGGETIKKLEERTGVKMYFVKHKLPAGADKPLRLRIIGDHCKVQQAQELVVKLIQDQEQTDFRAGRGDVVPKMGGSTLDERDGVGGLLGRRGQNDTNMAGPGTVQEVAYTVPADKCGLVIGKETRGTIDKPCNLTGTPENIEKAKRLLKDTKEQYPYRPGLEDKARNDMDGSSMQHILIPADKLGLVIGKGGETIKKLQERTGVKMKMFMDQRDQLPAGADGLLRITGDPCKVQQAQELVVKLIQDQEQTDFRAGRGDVVPKMGGSTLDERDGVGGLLGRRGQNDTNMAGPGTVQEVAYTVPADKCGLVIGKGMEVEDGEERGGIKDKQKKRKKTCKKKESAVTKTAGLR